MCRLCAVLLAGALVLGLLLSACAIATPTPAATSCATGTVTCPPTAVGGVAGTVTPPAVTCTPGQVTCTPFVVTATPQATAKVTATCVTPSATPN